MGKSTLALQPIFIPGDENSCENVDKLPAEWRALVHEFGYSVVRAYYDVGVTRPNIVRYLIRTTMLGAREPGNVTARFFYGQPTHRTMDMLLAEGRISSMAGLISNLRAQSAVILSVTPTVAMVQASIQETGRLGLVSKERKHWARLRAAIEAGAFRMPVMPDTTRPPASEGGER